MPLRVYTCDKCHQTKEVLVHGDPDLERLCECGAVAQLEIFSAGSFKIEGAAFSNGYSHA